MGRRGGEDEGEPAATLPGVRVGTPPRRGWTAVTGSSGGPPLADHVDDGIRPGPRPRERSTGLMAVHEGPIRRRRPARARIPHSSSHDRREPRRHAAPAGARIEHIRTTGRAGRGAAPVAARTVDRPRPGTRRRPESSGEGRASAGSRALACQQSGVPT
jgi:hypothetical protein